ncbi:hypothetical protein BGW80DRAFT_1458636 [Lactifluus volemus]|nr:hypothetical protein BGW80DRAFT_1458636 [Lactifluus volemus]
MAPDSDNLPYFAVMAHVAKATDDCDLNCTLTPSDLLWRHVVNARARVNIVDFYSVASASTASSWATASTMCTTSCATSISSAAASTPSASPGPPGPLAPSMPPPAGRSKAMNNFQLFTSTTCLSIQNNVEMQDFFTGSSYSEALLSITRCLLLSMLEVDGPDEVTMCHRPDARHVVSVLHLIMGDEVNTIRKLTAWCEIVEMWGGATQAEGVHHDDVVYFENILATNTEGANSGLTPVLTVSPNLCSWAEVCFI